MNGMHVFPIYFSADKSRELCSRQHASVLSIIRIGVNAPTQNNMFWSFLQYRPKNTDSVVSLTLPLAHATKTQVRPTICRKEETFYEAMFIAA